MSVETKTLLETKTALESELSGVQGQIHQLQKHASELTRSVDRLEGQIERQHTPADNRAALEEYWHSQRVVKQEAIARRQALLASGVASDELTGPVKSPIDVALAGKRRGGRPQFFTLPAAPESIPDEPPAKLSLADTLRFPGNPWLKVHWSLTEQMIVIKADPQKAEAMAKAAGVDVNAFQPAR